MPALVEAIRRMYGLEAKWLKTAKITEAFNGETVWEGEVQVFEVDHPSTDRVYAWSHASGEGKRRFHAVLGAPPVDGPQKAVQTALLSELKKRQN